MNILRIILGDQLSFYISSLDDCDKNNDIILMCEIFEDITYVKHHQKKIVFILSAMRHFAQELQQQGYQLDYITLDNNAGSLNGEVKRALQQYNIDKIIITHPSQYCILQDVKSWQQDFDIDVEIRADNRFLCSFEEFAQWANTRKQLRMEYFYREMRQKYSILMDGKNPIGGQWNYDSENRKPPKNGLDIPSTYYADIDTITQDVITLVRQYYHHHFGDIMPFHFAVTREQALIALQQFIDQRLLYFGDYQDAMLENEPWMYHAHISFYINCGLLLPMECVKAAERAYHDGDAPLNAVEGFIRQIIGWREYIWGIYWLKMPQYAQENFFNVTRNLPDFYWTAKTQMNCLHQVITETRNNAYAHHIQRLMVLGNFALIAGIEPSQVNQWFLIVYADAYEWVELPNVSGMILFADGGYLASKPYAAGGSYINKMSNYCKNCHYKVTQKNGEDACPFNYLYWDFLDRNRDKLSLNHRISMMYKTYDRMSDDKKQAIKQDSQRFLESLSC